MRIRAVLSAGLLAAVVCSGCGGSPSTPTPTPPPVVIGPTVLGITPSSGSTAGGTEVSIAGINFTAGATVTIGGVAATNVRVLGTTSIQAATGAHAAGQVDVVVTVDGQAGTLSAAFTFVTLPPPTIAAIAPTSGSTAGGTTVTLTGTNFASGATVTIGGVAATGVTVVNSTSLRAVTGARAAGAADVLVTVGGQSATLTRGFTYVVPPPNPLPVISSLTIQSTRASAPANFADVGEEVVVTATVKDNETPVDKLVFEWTADGGTFTGTGPSVRWRAPTGVATPAQNRLTLKVTETVEGVLDGGFNNAITQSVTASATVRVHDSLKEISDLSVQFLLDFSNSSLAPDYVVRNFWDGCQGKKDELSDVQNNRTNYLITGYQIGPPTSATIGFSGTCPFQNKTGVDGCVLTPVEWHAIYKPTGLSETSKGTDQTTAVYRESRWWLCDSNFDGKTTNPFGVAPFIR